MDGVVDAEAPVEALAAVAEDSVVEALVEALVEVAEDSAEDLAAVADGADTRFYDLARNSLLPDTIKTFASYAIRLPREPTSCHGDLTENVYA